VLEALQLGDPVQVGPYRLLGVLGEGGFGRVFLGQSANGRQVALKLILASHTDPEFLQRFRREAAAAARVSGRFTAPLVAADLGGPVPWLATEYVAGLSLAEQVRTNGPAPARSVLVLAAGLAEALEAIHAAGVVHRDLKPGNVLLAWDGPRVIDFGIARAAGSSTLTGTGTVIGTPEFMSPEQARGEEAGPASDVFSLGSVVAFAATGRPPFGSDYPAVLFRIMSQPADLGGLADERVRQLITGCLAKDPAWRPTPRGLLDYLGGAHPAPDWLSGPDPPINGSAPPLSRPAASAVRPAPATPPAPPPRPRGSSPLDTPPKPTHARPSRRWLTTLIAAAAIAVVSAIALPVLLTTGSPGSGVGHGPSTEPSAGSPGTTPGRSSPSTAAAGAQPFAWVQASPSTSPPGRHYSVMAYDQGTSQMVLFSGEMGAGPPQVADTWIWDDSNWSQARPATSPPARQGATMAYDAAAGQLILFGGETGTSSGLLNDTWTWNGTTWSQLEPATSPPARYDASMAYDPATRELVLFGGFGADDNSNNLNDTWTWNGTTWTQQHPGASPPVRVNAGLAYDPANGGLVLFGGTAPAPFGQPAPVSAFLADTWIWNGTTWTQQHLAASPPARVAANLVYDQAARKDILFGGTGSNGSNSNETWAWDGHTWTQVTTSASPPPRGAAAMAYDGATERVVLFSGWDGFEQPDTWNLDA
jgi:eukaryotic-like serine/threonine-protein kinase